MELIRRFPEQMLRSALADWAWVGDLDGGTPIATSAFGDVFLQRDDGVWYLDLVEGTFTRQWDSPEELQSALNTPEGQDRFLLAGLVSAAAERGLEPGPSEVLSFTVLPALGGALDVSNLEVADLDVALSMAGQLQRQVKDLPEGTAITGVSIGDDGRPHLQT
ncbi:T6SS immunity protein Tdi1 domain-containing protein [Knoellia remsis]|nr:T6SS immunity protein Tdi1 domain-containing protein [Knoellia remsis]